MNENEAGVFFCCVGRGVLDDAAEKTVRRAVTDPRAQGALISLAEMAGEGFEELLSEFTGELFGVHLLERDARTWQALLGDAGENFFLGFVVSGIVQGASRLGDFADSCLSPREMGSYLAYSVDQELRNPTSQENTEGIDSTDPIEFEITAPTIDIDSIDGYTQTYEIKLKRKRGWDEFQNLQADAKLQALTDGDTVRTIVENHDSIRAKFMRFFTKDDRFSGYDVDHIIDRQLGGTDDLDNLWLLDSSVNRSLGKQIQRAIKDYPEGTRFSRFFFDDE